MEKAKIESKFPPRPLTGGEIKALRAGGVYLTNITPENADEVVDVVIAIAYSPEQVAALDAEEYPATLYLFERIVSLSYGNSGTQNDTVRPDSHTDQSE